MAYAAERFCLEDADKMYTCWSNGQRDPASDIALRVGNGSVEGPTYGNGKLYVPDDELLYAYVLPREPDGPDLTVDSVTTSGVALDGGNSFDLSVKVRNRGNRVCPSAMLRYYRSDDPLISSDDTELASGLVAPLGASTTESSRSLTAPDENGCYFCGTYVDSGEGETATANNRSRRVAILAGARLDIQDCAPARRSFSE